MTIKHESIIPKFCFPSKSRQFFHGIFYQKLTNTKIFSAIIRFKKAEGERTIPSALLKTFIL